MLHTEQRHVQHTETFSAQHVLLAQTGSIVRHFALQHRIQPALTAQYVVLGQPYQMLVLQQQTQCALLVEYAAPGLIGQLSVLRQRTQFVPLARLAQMVNTFPRHAQV